MQSDLERILFDEPTIERRLDKIAVQISNDYRLIFMAHLLRRVPLPLRAPFEFAFCSAKRRNAYGTLIPITSGSKLKMSLWSVTGSISWNGIATFPISGLRKELVAQPS
jgi:hypothetical protein